MVLQCTRSNEIQGVFHYQEHMHVILTPAMKREQIIYTSELVATYGIHAG